jgi:glycerophosphoryl diester phosphodiesterase
MHGRTSPIIVAHRGLHDRHPENSLAAFSAAWEKGIAWCECDVQLSADGVEVVIHDETLERTTTGKGPVIAQSWSALAKLRLLDSDGNATDQLIPSLDQILRTPRGCRVMVETKPLLGDRILGIAQKVLKKRGLLQSFHATDMELARRTLGRRMDCAVLADEPVEIPDPVRRLHVDYRALDKRTMARLTNAGILAGAWTVNDSNQIRKLIRWGVAAIVTDRPVLARSILQRL